MPDESYEAGYRAGHLQGWMDAMARVAGEQKAEGVPPVQPDQVPVSVQVVKQGPQPPAGRSGVQHPPVPLGDSAVLGRPTPGTNGPGRPAVVKLSPAKSGTGTTGQGPTTQPVPYRGNLNGPSRPVETAEQVKARRERRDRQNINVTLYVASLLLVAAAALFIGTGLPPLMKFAGVCSVAVLFYGAGFLLHRRVPRLKPASVAFAGTGLALVPVIGLALYNFVWSNGPGAWLATSVIGTVAYVAAALRLESRVLAYLSLTFLVSTAWSGMAVLGAALVWYFVVLIGIAVLFTLVGLGKPGWLPPLFLRPIAVLHPVVVPAVAAAATFLLSTSLSEYALILGLCGAYFAVLAAVPSAASRLRNFYAARAALTVALAAAILDRTDSIRDGLLSAAAMLAVQSMAVALYGPLMDSWFPARRAGEGKSLGTETSTGSPGRALGSRWRVDVLATYALHCLATGAFAGISVMRSFAAAWVPDAGSVPLWAPVAVLLLTGCVLAVRLGRAAEFLPFVALGLAGLVSRVMGEWEFALMVLSATAFWLVRAARTGGPRGQVLLLDSRVAGTVAVPALAAALSDGRTQGQAVWFSLAAAAVAQQVLSAALQRAGRPAAAPQATLCGFAAVGTVGVAVLAALDSSPELRWAAILMQLGAAAVVGLLSVQDAAGAGPWAPRMGEVLPLVVAGVMVEFAFRWVSPGAGNIALAVVAAYLLGTALRLRARLHRWGYWWLSRVAVTVLALTVFDDVVRTAGVPVIAGEALQPATVLVVVLAVQLAIVLASFRAGRSPGGPAVDAGAVLAVQIIGCGLLWPLSAGSWQHLLIPGVAAASSVAAAFVLRGQRGTAWYVPASFVILMGLSAGNLALMEWLLGIFAAFTAVMVAAAPQAVAKGWYFIAARVLTAALAVVFSYDVTASPEIVSLTFAGVLTAQHVVRWLMRFRLQAVPFQQAAVWVTLAGQAALPVVYFIEHGSSGSSGGRWLLLLEAGLLLGSAIVARLLFVARGALYFGAAAVLAGPLTLSPLVGPAGDAVLDYTGTAVALLGLALAAAGAGVWWTRRLPAPEGSERWLWLISALSFTLASSTLAPEAEDWIAGAALLVMAGVFFCASHVERVAVLYAPASAAALGGTFMVAREWPTAYQGAWTDYVPWLAVAVAGVALYGVRIARRAALDSSPVRRWSLAGAGFAGLALASLAGLPADHTAWTAAVALAGAAGICVAEAPAAARRVVAEVGALVVLAGAQRAALFELDGRRGWPLGLPDPFWTAQWYVVLGGLVAFLRYRSRQPGAGRAVGLAAAALLTLSGVGTLFGGSPGQQLWLLVLLALLIAAGLLAGEKVFVRWGAAGVAACVLWAMRGYTFALLALIAAGLIVFAVWRLNRTSGGEQQPGKDAAAREVP